MKTCSKCKETKPFDHFHRKGERWQPQCKPCASESQKDHQRKNREKLLERRRKRWHENKETNSLKEKKYRDSQKGIWVKLHSSALQRSKKKGLVYELSPAILHVISVMQRNKCALTGIPFDLTRERLTSIRPFSPSLDRIDSKKGYLINNIQIVCAIANIAKNEFSIFDFDDMCRARMKVLGK